jgi:hypothetical protein
VLEAFFSGVWGVGGGKSVPTVPDYFHSRYFSRREAANRSLGDLLRGNLPEWKIIRDSRDNPGKLLDSVKVMRILDSVSIILAALNRR